MNACLLFIYSKENKTNDVILEKGKLPDHKEYYKNNNKKYKNKKFPNIEIYSSEFSGLGKSIFIKNKFQMIL